MAKIKTTYTTNEREFETEIEAETAEKAVQAMLEYEESNPPEDQIHSVVTSVLSEAKMQKELEALRE